MIPFCLQGAGPWLWPLQLSSDLPGSEHSRPRAGGHRHGIVNKKIRDCSYLAKKITQKNTYFATFANLRQECINCLKWD